MGVREIVQGIVELEGYSQFEKEIKDWLEDNGYEGLVDPDDECGCGIEGLMPCVNNDGIGDCEPGYKIPCTCGEDCGYHITTIKPPAKPPERRP